MMKGEAHSKLEFWF